jgi:hypothetical protein
MRAKIHRHYPLHLGFLLLLLTSYARADNHITSDGSVDYPAAGSPCAKALEPLKTNVITLAPGNLVYLPRTLSPGDIVIPPEGMEPWEIHYIFPPAPPSRSPKGRVTYKVVYPLPPQPSWAYRPEPDLGGGYQPTPEVSSGKAVPVLPIGGDQLDQGTVFGNVYSVYDKAGKNYSGVVVGDSKYSITYPIGEGDPIMRSGNTIINLGH